MKSFHLSKANSSKQTMEASRRLHIQSCVDWIFSILPLQSALRKHGLKIVWVPILIHVLLTSKPSKINLPSSLKTVKPPFFSSAKKISQVIMCACYTIRSGPSPLPSPHPQDVRWHRWPLFYTPHMHNGNISELNKSCWGSDLLVAAQCLSSGYYSGCWFLPVIKMS